MTKESFKSLSPEAQEELINSGVILQTGSEVSSFPSSSCNEDVSGCAETSVQSVPSCQPNQLEKPSSPEPILPQATTSSLDGILLLNPVELLFLVDEDIISNKVILHDWQIQFMLDFADEGNVKEHPFMAEVCAANGSGKDKYILAACIVWLCMRYLKAWGVATNGSGVQLDNQTERHIRSLCGKVNTKFKAEVWKCNYRSYTCIPTESVITLFATDEANKAEGFHPIEMGCKLSIFASEAKAVGDDIFTALARCLGVTHRVDVSSPGLPMGYFFDQYSVAVPRENIKGVKDVSPTDRIRYHITAYKCSHISEIEIENFARSLPGGKESSVFKSGILAEFGTTDEMVVIPYTYIWRAVNSVKEWISEPHNIGGLDLSDGGDETVLCIRNGNKLLKVIPFKFQDTEDTIDFLDQTFRENGLNHPEALVYADVGGMGKPMLNSLKRRGFKNIRFVDNRNTPYLPKTYKNRGAEVFFNMRLLLEKSEIILLRDDKMIRQLSTRYYKITTQNLHQLLTKVEQKSRGYPSPDRADAVNLCFWGYKSTRIELPDNYEKPFTEVDDNSNKIVSLFDTRSWSKGDNRKFKANEGQTNFSILENEITRYNARIKQTTNQ